MFHQPNFGILFVSYLSIKRDYLRIPSKAQQSKIIIISVHIHTNYGQSQAQKYTRLHCNSKLIYLQIKLNNIKIKLLTFNYNYKTTITYYTSHKFSVTDLILLPYSHTKLISENRTVKSFPFTTAIPINVTTDTVTLCVV